MISAVYLVCFGLLCLTSGFLTVAWGVLAWRRGRALHSVRALYHDRYMVLASALCLMSFGSAFMFGSRLITVLLMGYSAAHITGPLGNMIAVGMLIMLVSKFGFMWAIELDRRDKWWIMFLGMCICWVAFAIWHG